MSIDSNGPLRPRLDEVVEELETALEDVCSEAPPDQLTTGELIRVEENLAIAADAAKKAVSLRRKLHQERPSGEIGGPVA